MTQCDVDDFVNILIVGNVVHLDEIERECFGSFTHVLEHDSYIPELKFTALRNSRVYVWEWRMPFRAMFVLSELFAKYKTICIRPPNMKVETLFVLRKWHWQRHYKVIKG